MAQKPYRNASIVTARPVVPPPIVQLQWPFALSSGSQLNETAEGGPYFGVAGAGSNLNVSQGGAPWPTLINGGYKFKTSWRPNFLKAISTRNVAGNYGAQTSSADFGYRGHEFGPSTSNQALYPGTVPYSRRPMWNNLIPIIYNLRVINPVAGGGSNNTILPSQVVSQFNKALQFVPAGTASLTSKGEVLK